MNLLIVAHTPSPNLKALANALEQGAQANLVDAPALKVTITSPLESDASDLLAADAVILLTTENLAYMAGATKDWFDRVYYPVLELKQGLPVVAVIRAGHDGTGTCRALESIITGLRWRWVQAPIILKGDWQPSWIDDCEALGEAMSVALSQGII
ncbi:MAG: flavodoxin family protein [Pseudomonadota bacterium]|nr:flavodoxin family protein [Pseudomonadota bacterium]